MTRLQDPEARVSPWLGGVPEGWISLRLIVLIPDGKRSVRIRSRPQTRLLTSKQMEDVSGLCPERWGFHRVHSMKDIIKMVVLAGLALALSPMLGFWIVALVGAALFLIPAGAAVSVLFPKAWRHIEDSLFSRMHLLPSA